jgi:hypothetical protein
MTTEAVLQTKILKILSESGLMARTVAYRGRTDCPDVVIIDPPTVWLEIKSPKGTGRLRPGQRREHNAMRDHGAAVYVIESLEDLETILIRHYPGTERGD